MSPWSLNRPTGAYRIIDREQPWFWEWERTTPAGVVSHNFTWKASGFATAESVRSAKNRLLCHVLISYAPDEVINSLLFELGRFLLMRQQTGELEGMEQVERSSSLDRESARILRSIISARSSQSSPSAWSEDDVREP